MEKKKNKLAFTLVELIIVITILTILGTISFISYIDISIDTKNTKVITDIENINKKINIKIVRKEGTNLNEFLSGTGLIINKHTSGIGYGLNLSSNYAVGIIDFSVLEENKENFKDSQGNDYIYGYAGNVVYQVAGKIKNSDTGIEKALVRGSFYNISGDTIDGLIKEYNGTGSVVNNGTKLPY